jgi:predicted RNase H-like nuclease
VAVALDPSGHADVGVGPTIAGLVAWASASGPVALVAVDMPIGLPDASRRRADVLARGELGPRRSSVFMTPVRAALDEDTHARASAVNRERAGEGISTQAFNLRPKLKEVEALAFGHAYRFVEVHPEVSFARVAGRPLTASKKTPEGQRMRRDLLAMVGIGVATSVAGAAVDDVLDAAVAAWSGRRVVLGAASSLPDPPEVFSDGWPSAIWV